MAKNKTKIMFWDLETSFIETSVFSLYGNKFIRHENIIKDWNVICACWKFDGQSRIHSVSVASDEERFAADPSDDYYVIKTLREAMDDVDIIVGHNGDNFDMKKFNARLIYHKLPPLPRILQVDTLKQARKIAKFTSNRLDYIGDFLGVGGKLETAPGLWEAARIGDKKAIKAMVKYNKRDVDLLEKVYKALLPYMKGHPNIADVNTMNCPKCNSSDVVKHKTRKMASGLLKDQYQCKSCGGYFTDRKSHSHKSLSAK